jgi:hypothetical protein
MPPPFQGPQAAQPPSRRLGTSGVFFVPDLSPSINPAVFGPIAPRDKVRSLAATAVEALRTQGTAAALACRQIHGDQSLGESERHRRAAKASADLIMAALPHVEKARAVHEKSISELRAMLAGPVIEIPEIRQTEIRSKIERTSGGQAGCRDLARDRPWR